MQHPIAQWTQSEWSGITCQSGLIHSIRAPKTYPFIRHGPVGAQAIFWSLVAARVESLKHWRRMDDCDVVGVDLSPRQLELARRRLAAVGPHAPKGIDLVAGDMTSLSLGRQFALIVIPYSGLLELGTSDQRVSTLDVCRRHLQEGGTLVLDTAYIRN